MSAVTDAAGYLEPSQSKGGASCTTDVTPITHGGYPADNSDDYLMQSQSRGWAYILNLAGSVAEEDVEKLQTTLKTNLQFTVLSVKQEMVKDAKNTKDIVCLISEKVKEDEDCVFIAVLYQEKDINSTNLEKIWKVLVENNKCSKMMATKPKIFLFQEYQPTVSTDHVDTKSSNKTLTIPKHSDVLLIFGFGPQYISTLCSVLEEDSMNDDVVSLLTMVNEKFRNNGAPKLPFFTSMLNYDLNFPPKDQQLEVCQAELENRLTFITATNLTLIEKRQKLLKEIDTFLKNGNIGDSQALMIDALVKVIVKKPQDKTSEKNILEWTSLFERYKQYVD